jgi:hypothetical protein
LGQTVTVLGHVRVIAAALLCSFFFFYSLAIGSANPVTNRSTGLLGLQQNDSTPPPVGFFVNWINRIALVSLSTKQWKKSVLCNNRTIGSVTPDLTADEENQNQNRNQQLALI